MVLEERTDLINIVESDSLNAIRNLEAYVERNPNDAEAHCALAAEYLFKHRGRTREECEIALRLNPNSADAYFYLGEITYINSKHASNREEKIEKAKKYYEKALEKEPGHKATNYKLGCVYFNKENFDRAIERFNIVVSDIEKALQNRAKELGTDLSSYLDDGIYDLHQVVHRKFGKNPNFSFIRFFSFPMKGEPSYNRIYHLLAMSYKEKEMEEEAKEAAKKQILCVKCDERQAHFYLGCVHYEFEDYKAAIKEFERANGYFRSKINIDSGLLWSIILVGLDGSPIDRIYLSISLPRPIEESINIIKCIKAAEEKLVLKQT